MDICFDEYNYHDSLQASLIEEFGHLTLGQAIASVTMRACLKIQSAGML